MELIDLTGKKFGRWTVLAKSPTIRGSTRWKCRCDCGKVKPAVLYTSLVRGSSRSCGCLRREMMVKPDMTVHSQRNPMYRIWMTMRTRCNNASHPTWKRYGGRGIKVCKRWGSFDLFLKDMGLRPSPEHQLERKDHDGDYCPENCCWHTRVGQSNNRRSNLDVIWKGKKMTMTMLARQENVDYQILLHRVVRKGLPLEDTVRAMKENPDERFVERAVAFGGMGRATRKTPHRRTRTRSRHNTLDTLKSLGEGKS